MAESSQKSAQGSQRLTAPPAPRISLEVTPTHSPLIVSSPHSPAMSIQTIVEPAVQESLQGQLHEPVRKGNLEAFSLSYNSHTSSRAPSLQSDYSGISTHAIKSACRPTFSEEKEVVLVRDGLSSSIPLAMPDTVAEDNNSDISDGFMRAVRTRLGSVGGPDAFAPSPTRAVLELANARRVSVVLSANEGSGLGLYNAQQGPKSNDVSQESTEEGSSPTNDHEDFIVAAAKQARMNRSQMIEHRPGKRRVESKAARVLGEDFEAAKKEQGGIVLQGQQRTSKPTRVNSALTRMSINRSLSSAAAPTVQMVELAPRRPERPPRGEDDEANLIIDLNSSADDPFTARRLSIVDALRSNPSDHFVMPKRAATAPTGRKRMTTFSIPAEVHMNSAKRFSREGVLNTPYSAKDGKAERKFAVVGSWKEGEGYDGLRKEMAAGRMAGRTAERKEDPAMTVVLYSRAQTAPAIGKIVLPSPSTRPSRTPAKPSKILTWSSKSQRTKTIILDGPKLFDDEALFLAIRAEYVRLRGPLRTFLSARCLHGIRMLSYTYLSSLSDRETTQTFLQSRAYAGYGLGAEKSIEVHLEQLLHKPRKGRGQTEVVGWVRALCGNNEEEKIAVCYVEGWSLLGLFLGFALVLGLSVLAVVLWVYIGIQPISNEELVKNVTMTNEQAFQTPQTITSGAGRGNTAGRVETGTLLGVLVLLLGWTWLAGWAALSWLVM